MKFEGADQEKKPVKIKNGTPQRIEDMVGYFSGMGHAHPISEGVQEMRELMLTLGFDEIQTSFMIPHKEIKRLTGKLYPIFKDSVYHLSTIKMEPIPPMQETELKIKEMFPNLDQAELWNLLDTIDEDNSGEEVLKSMVKELGINISDGIELMNVIPKLRSGVPNETNQTLRSFMPTSWMSTIEAIHDVGEHPIRLFTVADSFRREPSLDPSHIQTYHILSLAVVDNDINIETGKNIIKKVFDSLGIEELCLKQKSYPFPYFVKGTELEIFGGDLELGTCGMISEDVLDERKIPEPVFIADIGIERVLMHKHGYPDIRELLFPQFFAAWNISDEDMKGHIRYIRNPQTDFGKEIASAIHKAYTDNADDQEKKKVTAWKGQLVGSDYGKFLVSDERAAELNMKGTPAEVVLKEASKGAGLCGPATFNQIWIKDGNIFGVPSDMLEKTKKEGGIKTNKTFVKAFSRYAAWKIEKNLERGKAGKRIDKIKGLEAINLKLDSRALYYLLSHKKKIDIQGPVYLKFQFRTVG
ncbi:MAG: hypothetical protein U9R75_06890 [Candidatus Thermoplasmatota archaeon]|nr:hypothetical protein [Candidatus Thermoplasmatota archaeon]